MMEPPRHGTLRGPSPLKIIGASLLLAVLTGQAQQPADISLDLGKDLTHPGLSVPSAGDGVNQVTSIDGWTGRRIAKDSSYLYVRVDDPKYRAAAPLDLYVTVTVADDDLNRVTLQYDKQAATPGSGTFYASADGMALLLGKGGVRTLHFFLPQARLGHGQNHGTDFRLCARNLAVGTITVSPRRPDGLNLTRSIDADTLQAMRVTRPPGMDLTVGNDVDDVDASILQALSVTSVESYVDWAGVEPAQRDTWDWSRWDRQVEILERHGLKWVPFLIAGPAYATPLWFQQGDTSDVFVCLEHDTPSKVQSIFNPHWPAYVDRFLGAFAARYRDRGVIESVLLGVTGIYGESIYPAGPEDGWTSLLTGPYHNHAGWWAGDENAIASFRRSMRHKYLFLWRLNRAWGSAYTAWAEVRTFLPDDAPNDWARVDMAQWYQQAMTDWSVLWVKLTRKHFPDAQIYLCTGGDGNPMLGADFTAQTKAISRYGAGIRITNEASNLAANVRVTREVATATRFYDTFAGFEPAGLVDAQGVVARIFNATASGVRQLHYYQPNILQSGQALENFRGNAAYLIPRTPEVSAALYVSRETWEVDPAYIGELYGHASLLRDLIDYDMVTRQTVRDGILAQHRVLIALASPILEPAAAKAIRRWVERGGILIVAENPDALLGGRLHDLQHWREALLPPPGSATGLLKRELAGPAPDSWALDVGKPGDADWLYGEWFHREQGLEWPDIPDARKRWSGANPGMLLPTQPGADYILRLHGLLSGLSLEGAGCTVTVNGVSVGKLDQAGSALYEFRVPASALGTDPLTRLDLHLTPWIPSENGFPGDARHLGIALRRVEWVRDGAVAPVTGNAHIRWTLDPDCLAQARRQVGKGWVLNLHDLAANPDDLGQVLGLLLGQTDRYIPGVPPLAPDDGRLDGVYTTRTATGILRYDSNTTTITEE